MTNGDRRNGERREDDRLLRRRIRYVLWALAAIQAIQGIVVYALQIRAGL